MAISKNFTLYYIKQARIKYLKILLQWPSEPCKILKKNTLENHENYKKIHVEVLKRALKILKMPQIIKKFTQH